MVVLQTVARIFIDYSFETIQEKKELAPRK